MIIIGYTVYKCSCNGAADDFTTSYCWQFQCALLGKPSSASLAYLHLLAQLARLWPLTRTRGRASEALYFTVLSVWWGKSKASSTDSTAGTLNATNWKRAFHDGHVSAPTLHGKDSTREQLRWDCWLDITRASTYTNTHTNKANVFGINFLLCQFTIV